MKEIRADCMEMGSEIRLLIESMIVQFVFGTIIGSSYENM
jgi:hypothetical protein